MMMKKKESIDMSIECRKRDHASRIKKLDRQSREVSETFLGLSSCIEVMFASAILRMQMC